MKKCFRPAGVLVACLLIFSAVYLTGCSKNDAGAMATDGSGASPTPPPVPSAPAVPGAQPAVARPGAKPGAVVNPADPNAAIPFDMVSGVIKPIKTVVEKDKETKTVFTYKRFKYKDWDGNVCVCQMPVGETNVKRSNDAWLATFDIYKVTSDGKKQVSRMHDFPFVSPPPADGQQSQPQGGANNAAPIPAPGGTSMPGH